MRRFLWWVRCTINVALLACGGYGDGDDNGTGPPPGPTTGSLAVTITGLPGGSTGTVTVTGPSGFSRTLTTTETLAGLTPGSYTVAAGNVSTPDARYAPTPASQTIAVAASTAAAAGVVLAATAIVWDAGVGA